MSDEKTKSALEQALDATPVREIERSNSDVGADFALHTGTRAVDLAIPLEAGQIPTAAQVFGNFNSPLEGLATGRFLGGLVSVASGYLGHLLRKVDRKASTWFTNLSGGINIGAGVVSGIQALASSGVFAGEQGKFDLFNTVNYGVSAAEMIISGSEAIKAKEPDLPEYRAKFKFGVADLVQLAGNVIRSRAIDFYGRLNDIPTPAQMFFDVSTPQAGGETARFYLGLGALATGLLGRLPFARQISGTLAGFAGALSFAQAYPHILNAVYGADGDLLKGVAYFAAAIGLGFYTKEQLLGERVRTQ